MVAMTAKEISDKHNALLGDKSPAKAGHNSNAQLKSVVERVERLEEEKKGIADDIRDVYAEAKGNGFDVKALRAIVKRRKQDAEALKEHEAVVDTYMSALGMLD